jgi:hypothetical protein
MSPAPEKSGWSRARWTLVILFIAAVQTAAVFFFSAPAERTRIAEPSPAFRLAQGLETDFLALNDPTLFALPHREGFSGLAWLSPIPVAYKTNDWSQAPEFLPLANEPLVGVFQNLFVTNQAESAQALRLDPIRILLPRTEQLDNQEAGRSTLRWTGELAHRPIRKELVLPLIQTDTLVTNTEVQVLVGADGWPLSFTLLNPGPPTPADQEALELIRQVRFEPLPADPQTPLNRQVMFGIAVFEWAAAPAGKHRTE